jgi:hypothetical protein
LNLPALVANEPDPEIKYISCILACVIPNTPPCYQIERVATLILEDHRLRDLFVFLFFLLLLLRHNSLLSLL